MARAIFISYRRDDTEGEAGRLFDDLVRTFGDDSVFMDVAGINPGIDFRKAIEDNVASCGVLLAMIGPTWATIADSAGHRRLDDAIDFVRLEIAAALSRNIAVIPVLVHDAKMPHPDQLPENLKNLAYRNSVELTHARWNSDVQLLTSALTQYVATPTVKSSAPVHATVPVQLPPANAPAEPQASQKSSSKTGLIVGGVALIAVIAAAAFFFTSHQAAPANTAPVSATPAQAAPATAPAGGTTISVQGSATTATAPAGPASAMLGMWGTDGATTLTGTDQDPSPERAVNNLARLQVSSSEGQIWIHAWGLCRGCDWGAQRAVLNGERASARWALGNNSNRPETNSSRIAYVTIAPSANGLSVVVNNTFSDHKPTSRQSQFQRLQ